MTQQQPVPRKRKPSGPEASLRNAAAPSTNDGNGAARASAAGGAASAGAGTDTAGAHHRHVPIYLISVAAELSAMHPQTLRQYDRMGLVTPRRQGGSHRRYSMYDVEQLRTIQQLSQDGVSLEGIRRILALHDQVEQLQAEVEDLQQALREAQRDPRESRVFAVGPHGEVVTLSRGQRARPVTRELVLWRRSG